MMPSAWFKAARLQLHTIGFVPLLLGNIVGWYEHGQLSRTRLFLSAVIGLLVHLVTTFQGLCHWLRHPVRPGRALEARSKTPPPDGYS